MPDVARRDETIDILRGAAITTMVCSNLAGAVLLAPHPFWLRCYGSFAAPVFILLAGMMVSVSSSGEGNRQKNFTDYLYRGVIIILLGALMDACIWQLYPFIAFDVLYLIGLAIPIVYGVSKCPLLVQWGLTLLIFALTPWLQKTVGYVVTFHEYGFSEVDRSTAYSDGWQILRHLLVDGWFPVFPWLGFAILGAALAPHRRQLSQWQAVLGLSVLLTIGINLWHIQAPSIFIRDGYSELFYPPTMTYMIIGFAVSLLGFCIVARISQIKVFPINALACMGKCALLLYLLHAILIRVITLCFEKVSLIPFLGLYGVCLLLLMCVAYGVDQFKQRKSIRNYYARLLLGG